MKKIIDFCSEHMDLPFFANKREVGLQPTFGVKNVGGEPPAYLEKLQYKQIRDKYRHLVKPVVAVIDNGTDKTHKDLSGNVIAEKDFTREGLLPADHSTHVTGIITGAEYGLSDNIPVTNYKALSVDGAGTMKEIRAALNWAIKNDIEILNLSIGSQKGDAGVKKLLKRFTSQSKRHFVVIAAGNDGGLTDYPAQYAKEIPGVISVASAKSKGDEYKISRFSSRGVVTVSYIGSGVISTAVVHDDQHRYMFMNGTSMAAPGVSALIALAKAIYPEFELKHFHYCARKACVDMGKRGKDNNTGYGLLHPINFLSEVEDVKENGISYDTKVSKEVQPNVSIWQRFCRLFF